MKKLLVIITVLFSITLSAQKIKFNDGIIFVDKKEWAKFDTKVILGSFTDRTFISTLNDEKFININDISFKTGKFTRNGNPEQIICSEIKFITEDEELNEVFEVGYEGKWIVEKLYKEKVLNEDGSINIENLRNFKKNYSEKITERQFLTK